MSFNTFGKFFRFTTWGESHGPAIGCVVDGCPPNVALKQEDIQKELNKRKPVFFYLVLFEYLPALKLHWADNHQQHIL